MDIQKTQAKKDKIFDDGLRYKFKAGGTSFGANLNFNMTTHSCFLCGTHRVRTSMTTRKIAGKSHAVCAPSCTTKKSSNQ